MDDGPQAIGDADEVRAVKSMAARIHRTAVMAAAVATAISLAL